MSDNYVSPVSRPAGQGYSGKIQRVDHYQKSKPVEKSSSRGDPVSAAVQESAPKSFGYSAVKPANVQLQFKIDPDTNDITVIVMDRDSDQVIRTIPPEELSELVEGDLLEVLT